MRNLEKALRELTPDERVTTLLRENARMRKSLAKKDSSADILLQAFKECYEAPADIVIPTPKKATRGGLEEAVLHLTDIHYGKRTESFSAAVCEARLLTLCKAFGAIVALRREFARIDTCKILLGGDMIEGEMIFPGQAHELDVDIMKQMVKDGPEKIAAVILFVLGIVSVVEIEAAPGNHGRQSRFANKRHNGDSIFYEIVRKLVEAANPKAANRIRWNLPLDRKHGREWYARFKVAKKWGGMLVHGDQIKGMLGFPWYGVGKKCSGWRTAQETAGFNFLWMGHFHTDAAFDVHDCRVFATGSIESDNEYALENFASAGRPKQRLGFFNERRGLLADYPIHL